MPNIEQQKNTDFHIHVLSDGNFVLSSDGDDYGYETVDELIAALKDELGGKEDSEDVEVVDKKKNVKKIMEDENEDSE